MRGGCQPLTLDSLDRKAGAVRSLWLKEALAADPGPDCISVDRSLTADVCIVGGGFTGLWTALQLKKADASLDVVIVEADICGGGASGRNGGFVMSLWSKFGSLRKLYGKDEAIRLAKASVAAIHEIGRFGEENGIDADFRYCGWLWTATSPAQLDAWRKTLDGIADTSESPYVELSAAEVAQRSGSATHLGGVFEPTGARIQPAMLARGLRRVALNLGVRIYEQTAMLRLDLSRPPKVVTAGGNIEAHTVVLALNAWAARFPEIRRKLVVVSSDIGATSPIPERLEDTGWSDGLCISDSRRLVNYYRTTRDGRVVFGKGGGSFAFAGRIDSSFDMASPREAEIAEHFHRCYPSLSDVPIVASWRGPIDYSLSGVPFFVRLGGRPDVLLGAGYSGNGVGPSLLGGRILASMAMGAKDEWSAGGLSRLPDSTLPPEPFRFLGGRAVRWAIARKERIEDSGGRPGPLIQALAGLDPTGFIDAGKKTAPRKPNPS